MDNIQTSYIEIDKLMLDSQNPRLPKSKRNGSQADIINFLLLESSTIELMEAIGQNGYFPGELLLVVPKEDMNSYIVIEGNRRLCSVKLLNNPELAIYKKESVKAVADSVEKNPPQQLPCLVFKNRSEITKYLGFVHVTGKLSWGLMQKAAYIFEMYQDIRTSNFQNDCRMIAKTIGSKSSYISRLILAYFLYNKIEDNAFYSIEGLSDTTLYLNYFVDGLNKESIRNFLGINASDDPNQEVNQEHLKELTTWWFKTNEGVSRVKGDSDSLKKLNAILGNKSALEAFRGGASLDKAYSMTSDFESQFVSAISNSLSELERADSLVINVTLDYATIQEDLKSIRKLAKKISDYVKAQTNDDDE